jgi:hypothetical protein
VPWVPPAPPTKAFLSKTLGNNMVLQRAPKQAVVWGFVAAGLLTRGGGGDSWGAANKL